MSNIELHGNGVYLAGKKKKMKKSKTRGITMKASIKESADEALKSLDKQIDNWKKSSEMDDPDEGSEPEKPGRKVHKFTKMPYSEKRKIKKGIYQFYDGSRHVFTATKSKGKWKYTTAAGKFLGSKKAKKKGGLLKKIARKAVPTKLVKSLYKNPLVKGALAAVPGVGPAMAAFDAAKSNKEKKQIIESPEFQKAELTLEEEVRQIAAKYGVESGPDISIETVLANLAPLKKSGKIPAGSDDDKKITALAFTVTAKSGLETASGALGVSTPVILIGAGVAAWFLFFRKR